MWKMLADFAKKIAFLTQDTQKNKVEIAELQKHVKELSDKMRQMAYENRRDRENAAHEYDKLLLRLENSLLRSERRTLTGKTVPPLLLEETDRDV